MRAVGFEIRVMPSARTIGSYTAGAADQRADDLMAAFLDPTIDGIICAIGGHLSSELLPILDFEDIARHPKVFCGYSDVTALHAALGAMSKLTTFYGPAVMTDWAELPAPATEMIECFLSTTSSNKSAYGALSQPSWEVVEHVDWSRDRTRQVGVPRQPFQIHKGTAEGPLVGGCLPVLCQLLGTPWFPEVDDCIMYLEFPPAPYSPVAAATDLRHLRNAGKFDQVAGLVIGRTHLGHTQPEFEDVVLRATSDYAFPVVSGIACGHTVPNLTLPLGIAVRLDGSLLTILQPAVT
jgi:muramoyltetrapeptide carboxypeptidase